TSFQGSHLSYTTRTETQHQIVVKVHGVFPSCCGKRASLLVVQFRRVSGRDSSRVVTPFVQVGTYPTRNFALVSPHVAMGLGPSLRLAVDASRLAYGL